MSRFEIEADSLEDVPIAGDVEIGWKSKSLGAALSLQHRIFYTA
jgi:hypothetical protein